MMLCMKKMIAGHRMMCNMVGIMIGIAIGCTAANCMVSKCSCSCGCDLKKKAKKAFKAIEDKLSV